MSAGKFRHERVGSMSQGAADQTTMAMEAEGIAYLGCRSPARPWRSANPGLVPEAVVMRKTLEEAMGV